MSSHWTCLMYFRSVGNLHVYVHYTVAVTQTVSATFEVVTAVLLKVKVFCVVIMCGVEKKLPTYGRKAQPKRRYLPVTSV